MTMQDWYLIRTKAGAERLAQEGLQRIVDRTLLPLAKMPVRQRGHTYHRVGPVFPTYLFAFFSLGHMARQIRYTPGVRNIVQFGEQAAVVPTRVIDQMISRCAEGPVDLSKREFSPGLQVKIVHGPFQKFDAVFEEYRSGSERVAVLLSVMNAQRRIVMPASMVIAAE